MSNPFGLCFGCGRRRLGRYNTTRMYLFADSAPPHDKLDHHPNVKGKRWKSHQKDDEGNHYIELEYQVLRPLVVRVWLVHSHHGRPTQARTFFVRVDPSEPRIRFQGFTGFGYVECQGAVDFERSCTTREQMEAQHSLQTIGPPAADKDGGPPRRGRRRVMFVGKRKK